MLRGSTSKDVVENLGKDERADRVDLLASQTIDRPRPVWGQVHVGGRAVAVVVQRRKAFRVFGWGGGTGPDLPPRSGRLGNQIQRIPGRAQT